MKRTIAFILIALMCLLMLASCKEQIGIVTYNKSDYLVLLYLSGDANNGDSFLAHILQAENALKEIRNADGTPKEGYHSVNVLALWDGPQRYSAYDHSVHSDSEARLLLLGPGNSTLKEVGDLDEKYTLSYQTKDISDMFGPLKGNPRQELNMSNPETLKAFLSFANEYYEADNVILIFGDHGSGPIYSEMNIHCRIPDDSSKGLIFDDDTNHDPDYCLTSEGIIWALKQSGYSGKNRVKLIIEDLCLEASIDEAYAFAREGIADYFMASENVSYGSSLGPQHLISSLKIGVPLESILKEEIVQYASKWGNNMKEIITYSLIDLKNFSYFESIRTSLNTLAELISDDEDAINEISLSKIVEKESKDYRSLLFDGSYTLLRDLGDLMDYMVDLTQNKEYAKAVSDCTKVVKDNLSKIIIRSYSDEKGTLDSSAYGLTTVTRLKHLMDILYLAGDDQTGYDYSNWSHFASDNGKWVQLITKISDSGF